MTLQAVETHLSTSLCIRGTASGTIEKGERGNIRIWKRLYLLMGLLLIVVGGCAEKELPPQPVLEARDRCAESVDVLVAEVEIIEFEHATWDNSYLEMEPVGGIPCLRERTPGWRAILEVNDEQTEVRVGDTGVIVRCEGQPALSVHVDLTTEVDVRASLDPIAGVATESGASSLCDGNGFARCSHRRASGSWRRF